MRTATRDRFLLACRARPTDAVPVWFMRQAGRSLPEYRRLKGGRTILEMCRTPELAVEATRQPVARLGVDAAILFSDIVVPLDGAGVEVAIEPGVGPVFAAPLRSRADVERLPRFDPDDHVPHVLKAVRALIEDLDVPLIGFAGGPFTLACYLIEGRPSKDYARARALMHTDPETWHALMERLGDMVSAYLRAQVDAGVNAIQIFDSWVGLVSRDDFDRFIAPALARLVAELDGVGVPRIYFGLNTAHLLPSLAALGCEVYGVDWRIALDDARAALGRDVALQGNLDPAICLAPWPVIEDAARAVLERGGGRGHIFNLGHGVLPATDPDVLRRLVDYVHAWEPRGR